MDNNYGTLLLLFPFIFIIYSISVQPLLLVLLVPHFTSLHFTSLACVASSFLCTAPKNQRRMQSMNPTRTNATTVVTAPRKNWKRAPPVEADKKLVRFVVSNNNLTSYYCMSYLLIISHFLIDWPLLTSNESIITSIFRFFDGNDFTIYLIDATWHCIDMMWT